MLKYSFDTSAILDGWKRNYPPDVFPTVWRRMEYLAARGDLIATEEVLKELEKQDDDVHKWLKERPHMVIPLDARIQTEAKQILAAYPRLVNPRQNRHQADAFVIALARIQNGVVVSAENRRSMINPKMPDVCDALGIRHLRFVEVLRKFGYTF